MFYDYGQPQCLYRIEVSDPVSWLSSYKPMTPLLQQEVEDERFFNGLGPEIESEVCAKTGCGRFRVHNSVMCRNHHFEMLTNRPAPAE